MRPLTPAVRRMKYSLLAISVLIALISCSEEQDVMDYTIIKSAEEGFSYLEANHPKDASFQLAISDSFTFAGKPDIMGAGMAALLDKILKFGFEPDGFEQKNGYKLYNYKEME